MIETVGLIGDPVAHSVSPAMQNVAFRQHNLPDSYVLWHTPRESLPARIAALREAGMRGANVTLPHKQAVVPLLDTLDPVAEAVGAVNTIVRDSDGRLRGLNTDVHGFLRALDTAGFTPSGCSAVVLGAGGATRAVVYALLDAGIESLTVANRTLERAEALLADMLALVDTDPHLLALALDDPGVSAAIASADILIDATSVGLDGVSLPLPPEQIAPHLLVVDLIYHTTPFLQAAIQRGARTQDGLEMLVQQGAVAFEAWTGLTAPVDLMRTAAQQTLKERT